MDQRQDIDQDIDENASRRFPDTFGTADVAILAAFLGTASVPVLNLVGPLVLLPFVAISAGKLIWPLLRWATARVSERAVRIRDQG